MVVRPHIVLFDNYPYPEVAMAFMNRHHRIFADDMNRLDSLIGAYTGGKEAVRRIGDCLNELLRHTQVHFSEEEVEMKESGFTSYPAHRQEHRLVLWKMQKMIDQWNANHGLTQLANDIRIVLPKWFVQHVQTMDLMTATWLAEQAARLGA